MAFEYPELLWLLLLLLPLALILRSQKSDLGRYFAPEVLEKIYQKGGALSQNARQMLLIGALGLGIVALANPYLNKGEIKVEDQTYDLIVGFDISRSMMSDDLYPNRFAFAKKKFETLLDHLKQTRVGVIGFSARAFLISPLTTDLSSLRYLVSNMSPDMVSLRGTSILSALESADELLKESEHKAMLLFTDGGDKKDYSKEIAYAKDHHITLFIYGVGTDKGGVIKDSGGVLKDQKGDIVIVKRNDAIASLARETGGVYQVYSLESSDMKRLAQAIRARLKPQKERQRSYVDKKELFYYPLLLSLLLFLLATTSLPQRRGA